MRRLLLTLFPPVLVLAVGLVTVWILLQSGLVLDLRWPFGLWAGLLPFTGGCAAGYRYPRCFGRAGAIVSLLDLVLAAGGLFFLGVVPNWKGIGLIVAGVTVLAWAGSWIGSGFAWARGEEQASEASERDPDPLGSEMRTRLPHSGR